MSGIVSQPKILYDCLSSKKIENNSCRHRDYSLMTTRDAVRFCPYSLGEDMQQKRSTNDDTRFGDLLPNRVSRKVFLFLKRMLPVLQICALVVQIIRGLLR
jgi:hypothetical protein